MSARGRTFIGTALMVAGAIVGGPAGIALAIAGGGLSASGQRQQQREAERRARAATNREAIRGNARGSHEEHLLVFGKARVGGIVVALGTADGPDMANQYVYMGVAHSVCHAGGCDGIEAIWIDETRVDPADLDSDGEVTTGDLAGAVRVTHYTGTGTQGVDAELVAAGIDYSTAYRRGIAWTLFRLFRVVDAEQFNRAFKFGIPICNVELRGIRCYDPRLDTTQGGAGSHRYDDPLTWEWTDNPILCAATYSIMNRLDGGEGIPPERVLWGTVAASASACEEVVNSDLPIKYRCNGVLSTTDDHRINLQKILDSCAGRRVDVGGKLAFHAGEWVTETFAIDETWLAGDVELQMFTPIEALYNSVRTNFNHEGSDYKTIEAVPYTNSSYQAEDGGELLFRDQTLPMVSDAIQAQYLGQIMGKRSRMHKLLVLACNLKALDVQIWETGTVDLSKVLPAVDWGSYSWRVSQWARRPVSISGDAVAIDVILEQDAASVYDPEPFTAIVTGDPPAVGDETGPAPEDLTATAVSDGIILRWTLPASYTFNRIRIERSTTGVGSWSLIGTVSAQNTFFTDPILDGSTYYYRINGTSRTGGQSLYSSTVSATARLGSDPASATVSNAGFELGDTGWDKTGAWTIVNNDGFRSGAWAAKLPGTGVSSSPTLRNTISLPCSAGELVAASGYLKSTAGANGTGQVRISWRDSAGAELSTSAGTSITPGTSYRLSKVQAAAPASTAYARLEFYVAAFSSAASEAWYADDSALRMFVDHLDNLPDGTIYGRPRLTALTSGEVDLSKAGVINRTADNISEATTRKWAAESGATVGAKAGTNLKDSGNVVLTDDEVKNRALGHWFRSYTVNTATPLPLVDANGAAFPTTAGYGVTTTWARVMVTAVTGATGTNTEAKAIFEYNGTVWSLTKLREKGTSSNHPEFFLDSGVPSIRLYSHASMYAVKVTHELINFATAPHLDEIDDGVATYKRVKGTALTSGEVDLSKAGVLNKSADNIAEGTTRKWAAESGAQVVTGKSIDILVDGATYGRTKLTALTSGEVDLSKAGVIGRNLGNIADDATYGRTKLTALTSGEVDLSKAGVLNKSADNITESGSRKWAGESGADVTSGKSIDVLVDGVTYGRPKLTALTSGEIDLSKAGVINKTLGNIADDATYGKTKLTALTSGEVDLSKAGVLNKTLGNIADDATYGRTKLTALTSGEVDLSKAGVLNRSADNITESGSRKWAAESGADVTAGKSIDVLDDVKTSAQFFTFTQTITTVGASTVEIPTGSKLLVIRAWGPGGGGARTNLEGGNIGGGGGGAACKKTVRIRDSDWTQTISYNVKVGGLGRTASTGNGLASTATTVTSSGLSFTNLNLSAGSGAGGTTAAGGAGGTASGGDTNTSGSTGIFSANSEGGWSANIDGIEGIGGFEDYDSGTIGDQSRSPEQPGGGGAGNGNGDGQNGADGMVTFTWSG